MKHTRKLFTILLAVTMIASLVMAFPAKVEAATVDVATYADLQTACSSAGSGDVTLTGDIFDGATELAIERDLALDLNGYSLTIDLPAATGWTSNGIKLASGVTLTIKDNNPGANALSVTNRSAGSDYDCGAAINTTDGTLIIASGTVIATGGCYGAGIGGGNNGNAGNITISGGNVKATGGKDAAGIGGDNECNITISGGYVEANGGGTYPGIGVGYTFGACTVSINGGMVTAKSASGMGIGNEITLIMGGNAVVFAQYIWADQSGVTKGILVDDISGKVYGDVTLAKDLEIPSGSTLTVPSGAALTVPGGVTLAANGTITNNSTLTNNGTLDIGDGGTSGSVTGDIVNNGNVTFNRTDNYTYAGVISGTGSLTHAGWTELTLSGNNTYTGDTTLSGGTLTITGLLGGGNYAGKIINNGPQVFFNQSGNQTLSGAISGSGYLSKAGEGTLTLTGNNTYNDGTVINYGLINFNNIDNFGTGDIILDGGGLQWAPGNTLDISTNGRFIINTAFFDTNGNNVTLAGNISGNVGLAKQGAGTLTLTGTNNIGSAFVVGGTLKVGSASALSGANIIAADSGGALDIGTYRSYSVQAFGLNDNSTIKLDVGGLAAGTYDIVAAATQMSLLSYTPVFDNASQSKTYALQQTGNVLQLVVADKPVYQLTVTNGTGGGGYIAGAQVPIAANAAPAGQVFDKWTSTGGGAFADANSATTTFTMPADAVTIAATYKALTAPVNVTKIDTPLKTVWVQSGKSFTIPCVAYDGGTAIQAGLTWTSSNDKIKVSDAGKVTVPKSLKKGKATITATAANGVALKVTVNVSGTAVKLTKATVTAPKSLMVGQTKKLGVKLSPAKATLTKITFKSSKASGLSVDKAGNVTALAKGKYTITVKVNGVTVKKQITVK